MSKGSIFGSDVIRKEADVRSLLQEVQDNPEEEDWRKRIAQQWLNRLDHAQVQWDTADQQGLVWEQRNDPLYTNQAYMLRSMQALLITQLINCIYDSSILIFSDYLRKKEPNT